MNDLSHLHLDYLVEIYQASYIETNGIHQFVSSADLAQRLFTNQSSVNRIIERLNNSQLIEYKPYVGVVLNNKGQQIAGKLLHKQSIIESFLIHTLKLEWHKVYSEARQLLHHVSPSVLDRMWEIIGKPSRSPFGEWINTPPNNPPHTIRLSDGEVTQYYKIDRILTRQPDRLQYLSALGLKPNTRIQFLHKAPFDGPLQIQLNREYRILAHDLGCMITIICDA